jgi:hypothetical protein
MKALSREIARAWARVGPVYMEDGLEDIMYIFLPFRSVQTL